MSTADQDTLPQPELHYAYNRTDMWHQLYYGEDRGIQQGTGCSWPINWDHEDTLDTVKNSAQRRDYQVVHRVVNHSYEFDLVIDWCGYHVEDPAAVVGLDDAIVYVYHDGPLQSTQEDEPPVGLYVNAVFHYPEFAGSVGTLHLDVQVIMQDADQQPIFENTYQYVLHGDGTNQEL
jgi:hypothetical protein